MGVCSCPVLFGDCTQKDGDDWVEILLEGIGTGCRTDGCLGEVHFVLHRGYAVMMDCRLCRQALDW